GAKYRLGLKLLVESALAGGLLRRNPLHRLASSEKVRDLFYYRLRKGTGGEVRSRLPKHVSVEVIGDALTPGKSKPAIASAYEAAFGLVDAPSKLSI
ncbi:MAG: hypothetical protein ABW003_22105, partial [Microvirga sp.]